MLRERIQETGGKEIIVLIIQYRKQNLKDERTDQDSGRTQDFGVIKE